MFARWGINHKDEATFPKDLWHTQRNLSVRFRQCCILDIRHRLPAGTVVADIKKGGGVSNHLKRPLLSLRPPLPSPSFRERGPAAIQGEKSGGQAGGEFH